MEPLPAPLLTNRFEYTKDKLRTGWQSSKPGSTLEFTFEGAEIRIAYYRIKGDMGTILAQVDGLEPVKIDSWFDQDWGGYDCEWPIGKDLNAQRHTLKIELLEEKNQNSNGYLFKLRAC